MSKSSNAETLTISLRAVHRWIVGMAVVGIALGVVGLRAAYDRLGADSAEGHILTVAIVVAAVSVVCTIVAERRATR